MYDSPPWAAALDQLRTDSWCHEPELLTLRQNVAHLATLKALSEAQVQLMWRVFPVPKQMPVAVPPVSQDMQHCSNFTTLCIAHRSKYQLPVNLRCMPTRCQSMYAVVTMSDHMCDIPLLAVLGEINHVHVSQAATQTPVISEEKILAALAAGEQLLAEEEEAAVRAAAKKAKKARQKVKRQQAQHSQPVTQGSGADSTATQYSAAQASVVLDAAQQPTVPHSSASDESASLFLDAQDSAALQIDAQDTEAPRSQTQGSQAQDSAAQDTTAGNTVYIRCFVAHSPRSVLTILSDCSVVRVRV